MTDELPLVRVYLKTGETFLLDPSAGATPAEVIERLSSWSLTGSAAPFAEAWLPTYGGGVVRYTMVDRLEPAE